LIFNYCKKTARLLQKYFNLFIKSTTTKKNLQMFPPKIPITIQILFSFITNKSKKLNYIILSTKKKVKYTNKRERSNHPCINC
jgi:hypothetical protein